MKSINELKKNIPKADIVLAKIRESITSILPDADIILYGSRARGDMGKESDWDLLILVNGPIDRRLKNDLSDSLYDIELETDEVFSSIIRSKKQWNSPQYSVLPFKKNIEREGILL